MLKTAATKAAGAAQDRMGMTSLTDALSALDESGVTLAFVKKAAVLADEAYKDVSKAKKRISSDPQTPNAQEAWCRRQELMYKTQNAKMGQSEFVDIFVYKKTKKVLVVFMGTEKKQQWAKNLLSVAVDQDIFTFSPKTQDKQKLLQTIVLAASTLMGNDATTSTWGVDMDQLSQKAIDAVGTFVDECGLEFGECKFSVIGHSRGGSLACTFAAKIAGDAEIQQVVTFGSSPVDGDLDDAGLAGKVLHVRDSIDPIPLLVKSSAAYKHVDGHIVPLSTGIKNGRHPGDAHGMTNYCQGVGELEE
jgi:hypothetical protein